VRHVQFQFSPVHRGNSDDPLREERFVGWKGTICPRNHMLDDGGSTERPERIFNEKAQGRENFYYY